MMESDNDRLSQIFAALANSTRRAILARLAEGEATVNELAEPFHMSLPAISKHIKVLERAGLIIQGQKAQFRPCTIDVTPLQEVATWTEQYRHIWEDSFDRMDDYINRLNQQEQTKQEQAKEEQTKEEQQHDEG
ncbi:MAG: metalloregulator ArsR/SmtB family transcription factor [Caldilineaceae bacterium]